MCFPCPCRDAVERELGVKCHVDLRGALKDEYDWLRETGVL